MQTTSNQSYALAQVMEAFGSLTPLKAAKPKTEFNLDPLFVSAVKHSVLHNALMLPYDAYNKAYGINYVPASINGSYGHGSLHELDKLLSSPIGQTLMLPREKKMASDITQYYQQKYTMNALKDANITNYHRDVLGLLNGDKKSLDDQEIGLITMLPLFYEYDMKLDNLMDGKVQTDAQSGGTPSTTRYKLKFLDKLTKNTKSSKEHNYFFTDEFNRVYMISIDSYQKLIAFFEHFIKSNEWIEIKGHTITVTHSHSYGILQFVNKWEPVIA